MPNLPISMLIAQSEGLPPETRKKLLDLQAETAAGDAAAVAGAGAFPLNPAFQPPEEQGFSLAGNAQSAGGIGSALLGNAPPQTPPRPRVQDTTGWKQYQEAHEKYRKTPWFFPKQRKDRLEADMARALDVARLEMVDAQHSADRLDSHLREGRSEDLTRKQLEAAEEERKARMEKLRVETERLSADTERLRERPSASPDIGEGRRPRDRFLSADGALYDTGSGKWLRPPQKPEPQKAAPKEGRPPWEEAFQKALPSFLNEENLVTGKGPTEDEILAKRDLYRRLFGAEAASPGLEGAGRSAAPVAINPKTGEQIQWVDGKWVPIPRQPESK